MRRAREIKPGYSGFRNGDGCDGCRNGGYGGYRDCGCRGGDCCGDGGFTVIEMLIAFTILAIVAGSIFQIFNVSARNNELAAEYDNANNLAITAVELFKSDPTLSDTAMFDTGGGFNDARVWRSDDGARLLKYYDGEWAELIIPPTQSLIGDASPPEGAVYSLEVLLDEIVETDSDPNYMTGAVTVSLGSSDSCRLVVNESRSTGDIEIDFNGIPQDVMQARISGTIPINVNYEDIGVIPKHVAVVNKTERTVNVNVFGVPVSAVAAAGENITGAVMNPDYGRYISVSPVEGALGVMFFDDLTQDSLTKTIAVSVRNIGDDGGGSDNIAASTLAHIEASKYIAG